MFCNKKKKKKKKENKNKITHKPTDEFIEFIHTTPTVIIRSPRKTESLYTPMSIKSGDATSSRSTASPSAWSHDTTSYSSPITPHTPHS